MSNIIPFNFENHSIRVCLDENNAPWFNAKDVCGVLGYSNARKSVADHVDSEDVTKRDTLTEGGIQQTNHINESGLYALILGSNQPDAKRFKRWVTHDVLPSIRKTGSYTAPGSVAALPASAQDRVCAILLIGDAIARVPGVKPGIAMAATLTCISDNTGLQVEQFRRALPVASEPICSLNPTQIGELVGVSARSVNSRLQNLGFQFKNDRDEWELTESGKKWAAALPYSRNGHAGYQILWNPVMASELREVA